MAGHCQAAEEKLDGNGDEAQQDQEDESKLSMLSQSLMSIMTSRIIIIGKQLVEYLVKN